MKMIGTNFGIYRPAAGSSTAASAAAASSGTVVTAVGTGASHHIQHTQRNQEPKSETGQQISDFLLQLEDYVPTVPEAVTGHFLNTAGFESNDPRIVRLISIATQKFISDVANDALHHCKARTNQTSAKNPKPVKDRKYTLTIEDLSPALADFGITVRNAQYYP